MTKNLMAFPKLKAGKNGIHSNCYECIRKYRAIYRSENRQYLREKSNISAKKNRPKNRLKYKDRALKMKYGITLDEYNIILKAQNFVCKICYKKETGKYNNGDIKSLAVDHCHKTKKVRGLLCENCNRALGLLKEDINIVQAVIEYLKGNDGNSIH